MEHYSDDVPPKLEPLIKYSIDYPPAAEILIAGEEKDIADFCLDGLTLAVKEQKMDPAKAKEYYQNWFGRYHNFEAPADTTK